MRQTLFALAAAAVLALVGLSYAADQTVIVPASPDKPVEVTEKDTVRISAVAIAGSKIDVDVKGDAKLDKKTIIHKREGARNLIGVIEEEYEIKPTGKGKATVKVTITPPTGNSEAKTYQIEIK
jgi:hypothetical protein